MILLSALDDLVDQCTFEKIEALTRYPQILSFHKIENNLATNQLNELPDNYQPLPTHPEKLDIVIQEKIQGTNCRIIIFDTDFFIGTNDEIIYAKNDRIASSPIVGPIINTLQQFIQMNQGSLERMVVLYGQAFGKGLPNANRYTKNNQRAFRVFDGFSIPANDAVALCNNRSVEDIAIWVDNLQQSFFSIRTLKRFCDTFNINQVPILFSGTLDQVPTDKTELLRWTIQFADSKLVLDKKQEKPKQQNQPKNGKISIDSFFDDSQDNGIIKEEIQPKSLEDMLYGKSAGIIIRTLNRSYIRSISFENYLQQKKSEEKSIPIEKPIIQSTNNIFDDIFKDEEDMPNLAFQEKIKKGITIPTKNENEIIQQQRIQRVKQQEALLQQDIQNKNLDIIQTND